MKKILKNIFKPFLFVCLGLIATITFASYPFGPPGQPGKPKASGVTADGCVIAYTAPTSNGGSPIQGYFIEYKSKDDYKWRQVNRDSICALDCKISGMRKGDEGEFRVIAKNAAGRGKLSEPSDLITFKDELY